MKTQDQQIEDTRVRLALMCNMCPDCSNYGFYMGPRGGAGRNVFCANPSCRSGFNIAPVHEPLVVERIEKGRDCYYPPRAHALSTPLTMPGTMRELTLPLCVFNCDGTEHWPIGHTVAQNVKAINCPDCEARVRELWSRRHDHETEN